jgi:serine/threonine protein kinase
MSMIGKTLGNFECTALLGMGGMGEVYRAKDQKLGRDVAIKVLPEEFAKDVDRVARFQREAKLLASLNHPNIAAIHGLEESDGTHFLVLELIEGDTLADRLKHGAIPVEESLKLALQIAEALEAAHEKGVIHRDLKPANIKVTPDGMVKVLDFGLAKAFAGDQEVKLSNSPTLSEAATMQGVILGTAAYMPPEQAKGKTVDKRADIWAFGVVLFEMLTGKQLLSGETVSETLASVLKTEPEWTILPTNLHPRIRFLLERCLKKEPKNRCSGISDARVDIQEVLADPSGVFAQPVTVTESRTGMRKLLPWVAAALAIGAIVAGVAVWMLRPTEPTQVVRFIHELPESQQFNINATGSGLFNLAVSTDGSQFVYSTTDGLYLRSMKEYDAKIIAGTDGDSRQPFFSPDGQFVGYWSRSDQKLKKIAISGGPPAVLCDTSPLLAGASWDLGDTIVYSDLQSGIMRVSANGGTPEPIIKVEILKVRESGLPVFPQMLPDGKILLFTNLSGSDSLNVQIEAQSLETGDRKVLVKGGFLAKYLTSGHIVYRSATNNVRSLFAVPFDSKKLEVGGQVPLLQGVQDLAISDSGVLVYIPQTAVTSISGSPLLPSGRLVWVDKQGNEEPLAAKPDPYGNFSISPDGTRVALGVLAAGRSDIWIWDFHRENRTRLTFEGTASVPLWTPDSKRIIYTVLRETENSIGICSKAADGTGEAERIYSGASEALYPFSSSIDWKTLVLWAITRDPPNSNVAALSMEGEHERTPLLQKDYNEGYPKISPDGRWMAYQSDESGKTEVYVSSFPDVTQGKWLISTNGGDSPLWSPDGKELFYRSGDSFMAVDVETDPVFKLGKPKVLFRGTYSSLRASTLGPTLMQEIFWDIHPDGKRFLMVKPQATTGESSTEDSTEEIPRKINVVLNWSEELKERVPID